MRKLTEHAETVWLKKLVAAESIHVEERRPLITGLAETNQCNGFHRVQANRAVKTILVLMQRHVDAVKTVEIEKGALSSQRLRIKSDLMMEC